MLFCYVFRQFMAIDYIHFYISRDVDHKTGLIGILGHHLFPSQGKLILITKKLRLIIMHFLGEQ